MTKCHYFICLSIIYATLQEILIKNALILASVNPPTPVKKGADLLNRLSYLFRLDFCCSLESGLLDSVGSPPEQWLVIQPFPFYMQDGVLTNFQTPLKGLSHGILSYFEHRKK